MGSRKAPPGAPFHDLLAAGGQPSPTSELPGLRGRQKNPGPALGSIKPPQSCGAGGRRAPPPPHEAPSRLGRGCRETPGGLTTLSPRSPARSPGTCTGCGCSSFPTWLPPPPARLLGAPPGPAPTPRPRAERSERAGRAPRRKCVMRRACVAKAERPSWSRAGRNPRPPAPASSPPFALRAKPPLLLNINVGQRA